VGAGEGRTLSVPRTQTLVEHGEGHNLVSVLVEQFEAPFFVLVYQEVDNVL